MQMLAGCQRIFQRRATKQCRYTSSSRNLQKVIFSGIQPTGIPHLGNYLGALRNWVSLQNSLPRESTIFYGIVDLHAITVPYDRETLKKEREEMWYSLYAVGIDMQRCVVFEQSAVRMRPTDSFNGADT